MSQAGSDMARVLRGLPEPVLFMGSLSFEHERCLAAAKQLLAGGFRPEQVRMIDYVLDPPTASATQAQHLALMRSEREQRQKEAREAALGIVPASCVSETFLMRYPLVEARDLLAQLAEKWEAELTECASVLLDVSTLAKPVMFPLLRLLREDFGVQVLAVANSVPAAYSRRLTYEIGGVGDVAGFNGDLRADRQNALIAVLGFDGDKLEKVVDYEDFQVVVPVVGFPAFHAGLQDRTICENARVLKTRADDNRVVYCPTLDPAAAVRKLREIRDGLSSYNVCFAPLGPKPMAVAVAEVARETNSRVVVAYPQAYSPSYSTDVSETHVWLL
jgi:hypothetical protein